MKAPKNKRFYFEVYIFFPSAHVLYRRKEDNICPSIWDKSEVLWRTCWGTYWELMRIHWELEGKIVRTNWEPGNNEKNLLPLPTEKGTKNKAP
jgi:hypothetical protein